MKKIVFLLGVVGMIVGCVVDSGTALSYATRAHPECSDYKVISHHYGDIDGGDNRSLTEVSMKCGEIRKSIVIKCQYGMGIVSDTVCYENN